jgi:hypothetical protein
MNTKNTLGNDILQNESVRPVPVQSGYGIETDDYDTNGEDWGSPDDTDEDRNIEFQAQAMHQKKRNILRSNKTQNIKTHSTTDCNNADKVVIHMTIKGKTIKQIHQLKLDKWLSDTCKEQVEAKHTSTGALRIVCTNAQASLLKNNSSLPFSGDEITFVENNHVVHKNNQGLIHGIAIEYSDDEIKSAFKYAHVTNIRRFIRNMDNIKLQTETVLLTFAEGYECPKFVKFGSQFFKVSEFVSTAPRCTNCQRFGHTKFICVKPPKCAKCGEKHSTNVCDNNVTIDKCVNCGGPHRTGNRVCRFTKQATTITRTAVSQGISYADAARRFHATSEHQPNTVSPIVLHANHTLSNNSHSTAIPKTQSQSVPHTQENNQPTCIPLNSQTKIKQTTSSTTLNTPELLLSNEKFVAMLTVTMTMLIKKTAPTMNETAELMVENIKKFFPLVPILNTNNIITIIENIDNISNCTSTDVDNSSVSISNANSTTTLPTNVVLNTDNESSSVAITTSQPPLISNIASKSDISNQDNSQNRIGIDDNKTPRNKRKTKTKVISNTTAITQSHE